MASQATPVNQTISKLINKEIQLMKTDLNIKFNKQCKQARIIPNYVSINIRNKSEAAQKTLEQAKILWIKNEIKFLHKNKAELLKEIKQLKLTLGGILNAEEFQNVIKTTKIRVKQQRIMKIKRQENKIKNLTKDSNLKIPQTTKLHEFYPKIINLTDISLNKTEIEILEKNPKYNPQSSTNKQKTIADALMQTEIALQRVKSCSKQDEIRYAVTDKIKKELKKSTTTNIYNKKIIQERQTIKCINKKLEESNAQIIPADKSNSSVIIQNDHLDSKVHDYLIKNNITKAKDLTNFYNSEIKDFLKNNNIIAPHLTKHLVNPNPSPPIFRPLIKTHKEDQPIRPVINAIPSPSYKIAKYINKIIKANIKYPNAFLCKNTTDFLNKLKNCKLENRDLLISIDIENMYGNIPRNEAITILKQKLKKSDNFTTEEIEDIIKITKIITNQSYFSYKQDTYYDPKGLPMGGPLSATLAEIYIQHFEETHIINESNPNINKIKFYARYVDDAFLAITANERQANLILNHLNSIHENIKFKMEIEQNKKINFLDITVTRDTTNQLNIEIYRKPTQTDLIIPADSNHPYNYKISALRSMVYRLLNYNLKPQAYKKEEQIIKMIAIKNGYRQTIIDSLITKTKQKMKHTTLTEDTTTMKEEKYIPIKYVGKITETIGRIFKQKGLIPAYKVKSNPIPHYKTDKSQHDPLDEKGIYKITCKNDNPSCNMEYIGYTNRSFRTRFKEHNASHHKNPESVVAKHLKINNSHNISINIIKRTHDKHEAQANESYQIFKYIKNNGQNSLLNKKEDFHNSIIFQTIKEIEDNNVDKYDNTASLQYKETRRIPPPPRQAHSSQNRHDLSSNLKPPVSSNAAETTVTPVRECGNNVGAKPGSVPFTNKREFAPRRSSRVRRLKTIIDM